MTTGTSRPDDRPNPPSRRSLLMFVAGAAVVVVIVGAYLLGRTHGASAGPTPAPVTTTASAAPRPTTTAAAPTTKSSAAEVDPALAGAQQGLKQLGYYSGPIDGQDTPATRAALTAFQTWAKSQPFGDSVTVTGQFDPPTQYALNVALGGNADGPGSAASTPSG